MHEGVQASLAEQRVDFGWNRHTFDLPSIPSNPVDADLRRALRHAFEGFVDALEGASNIANASGGLAIVELLEQVGKAFLVGNLVFVVMDLQAFWKHPVKLAQHGRRMLTIHPQNLRAKLGCAPMK